ncbi:MAG: hypothetical protein IJ863_01115 [Spirochaetales bacterium]|nr:hypothetical protein [Spirochaetales bacterium]
MGNNIVLVLLAVILIVNMLLLMTSNKRKAWITKFILKDSAEFVTKLKSLKK